MLAGEAFLSARPGPPETVPGGGQGPGRGCAHGQRHSLSPTVPPPSAVTQQKSKQAAASSSCQLQGDGSLVCVLGAAPSPVSGPAPCSQQPLLIAPQKQVLPPRCSSSPPFESSTLRLVQRTSAHCEAENQARQSLLLTVFLPDSSACFPFLSVHEPALSSDI